jgi:uncharacterized protein (DUF433 family)
MHEQTAGRRLRRLPFPLEQGIYLQAEAALFTGLPRTTVRRWLQLERGEATPEAIAAQPLISFLDLISLRAVAALRQSGLRLPQIRRGVNYMRTALGIDYPLATEDLRTDGVRRYFVQGSGLLAVDAGGQDAAQELVDQYLQDVRYKPFGRTRLATSWEPPGVTIDPERQRGAPCVAGSRVQIAVLQRYVDAGDSPERLAEWFQLDLAAVETSLQWYVHLRQRAA